MARNTAAAAWEMRVASKRTLPLYMDGLILLS